MSLTKLKKDELVALAEANDLGIDSDWNKAELIEELEAAGISAENDGEGNAHLSKADRQKRLLGRTDQSPGEAENLRSKGEREKPPLADSGTSKAARQKRLLARTDRTA